MSAELSLSIALAAHANAYCHDCLSAAELASLTDGPAFRYVKALQFGEGPLRPPSETIPDWLETLRRQNTKRLRLEYTVNSADLPPAIAAAFANANPTAIVVTSDKSHMLLPRWSSAPGGSQVVYYHFTVAPPPPAVPVDVAGAGNALRRQLAEARAFAIEQDQAHWDKYLSKASAILGESEHQCDLLPTCGYTAAAHRLASAASAAWVFGGMGSWNDMGIADRDAGKRYAEITDTLFAAVINGYLAAANSFESPTGA